MEPSQTIQDKDKLSNSLPEDLSLDFFEYEQGAGSNIVLPNKLKGYIQFRCSTGKSRFILVLIREGYRIHSLSLNPST